MRLIVAFPFIFAVFMLLGDCLAGLNVFGWLVISTNN
jgi:hypothetical protein